MKNHEIKVDELIEWKEVQEFSYAKQTNRSSSKEFKLTLYGGYRIYHNGKQVFNTIYIDKAMQAYNDILINQVLSNPLL